MGRWDDFVTTNPRIRALLDEVKPYVPPLNYITVHYAYFILVCLLSSLIFYLSSPGGPGSISYVDSLFLVVSAMTEAGLNTVNLSQMNTWQQVMLLLLIMLGSTVWVSIWTVLARKHVFEKRFEEIVERMRKQRLSRRKTALVGAGLKRVLTFGLAGRPERASSRLPVIEEERPESSDGTRSGDSVLRNGLDKGETEKAGGNATGKKTLRPQSSLPDLERGRASSDEKDDDSIVSPGTSGNSGPRGGRHVAFAGLGTLQPPSSAAATSAYEHHSPLTNSTTTRRRAVDDPPPAPQHRHSWHHFSFLSHTTNVSRNAGFYNLSHDEKETIGGCEYRALNLLSCTVTLYFFLWQALGGIAVGAWINTYAPSDARGNGANPWWTGIFYSVSAFNNSGMSLLDANMVPFQKSPFVLLAVGLLILAGNTAFPIFLRLTLWTMFKLADLGDQWFTSRGDKDWAREMHELKATLQFILKYPRRVYTNLFAGRATWWLLFMLIWLNGIDWVAFVVMNIGNKAIETIPAGYRALDGLFQAFAVRSGGFFVIPIPDLYVGLQVLYAIMMYISVYPVVITMRHSNVYEERSLGIYSDEADATDPATETQAPAAPAPVNITKTAVNAVGTVLKRTMTSFNGVGAIRPPPKTSSPFNSPFGADNDPSSPVAVPLTPATTGPGLVNLAAPADSRVSFIRQQVQGQLSHDLWWLVVAIWIIVTIETRNFLNDPVNFSVFNVVFEVISAYGCVGISVGTPVAAFSFCGTWSKASKLVLCLVMLRGRHRGLPVALDRAVRLPGERLLREEEEDWQIRTGALRRVSTAV